MTLSQFQFSNPVLTQMIFSLNEGFVPKQETQEIPIEAKVRVGEKENRQADVALSITVGRKSDEYPFFISATMQAKFYWEEAVSDEMADKLLNINAPVVLLGYIRPHIAQITEASPINTIHIPLMNFLEQQKDVPQ